MAYQLHRYQNQKSFAVASDLSNRRPVILSASTAEQVVLAASANLRPFGLTGEASALQGAQAVVYDRGNIVKAVCGASCAVNTAVGVASTNGALGPVIAASAHWEVGTALEAANPGEVFTLYVEPRKA